MSEKPDEHEDEDDVDRQPDKARRKGQDKSWPPSTMEQKVPGVHGSK